MQGKSKLFVFFSEKLSIYSSTFKAVQINLEVTKIISRSIDHLATTTTTRYVDLRGSIDIGGTRQMAVILAR